MKRPGRACLPVILLLIVSCSTQPPEDFFFIERAGATMPVAVRGNEASDRLIVLLHGGPGSTGWYLREYFADLESDYRVVYWDQRCSGASQGNTRRETITLDEFAKDLDLLVDVLSARYPSSSVFLLGHSWGGFLGTYYLLAADHRAKIAGFINTDGAHDHIRGYELSRQWVIDQVTGRLASGDTTEDWQAILDWYQENPSLDYYSNEQHVGYIGLCGGYIHQEEYRAADGDWLKDYMHYTFVDGFNVIATAVNWYLQFDSPETLLGTFHTVDLSPQASAIDIPLLILWGQYDGRFPVELAQETYDSYGTDPLHKQLVVFAESGHSPFIEESAAYFQTVRAFVQSY